MINKNCRLYILFALFSTAGVLVFADQPDSSLDDKPSVDTAATSSVQVPAVPANSSTATSTSYLYDLKKLIEKSRENIKEVNEKIKEQAVLKRNQKREERAREYYEKGLELTNEGKLNEARDYFEKAIRITEHPEMSGYIRESQERLKKEESALSAQEREKYKQIKQDENVRKEDVEAAYKVAVDLYKQKKYHPAKDAFEHVEEIAPDYRATSSYLKIIDQDIVLTDAQAVRQQAAEIDRQQQEAEAARAKEKAVWLAQIEEKEKEHKEAIDKQAEDVYAEAVVLYKNKKFAEAKKKFEEVSWVIPDYKLTMKYLGRIDRDAQEEQERVAKEQQKALQEQAWEAEVLRKKQDAEHQAQLKAKELQRLKDLEEQAQFLYAAAVNLYKNKAMDQALEKFNDIENTCPDFKSTRVYIARIKQWQFDQQQRQSEDQRRQQQEAQEQKRRQLMQTVDTTYTSALDHYRAQEYEEAKKDFLKVNEQIPDYRSTQSYLNKIEKIEEKTQQIQTTVVSPPAVVSTPVVVAPAPTVVVAPSAAVVATPAVVVPAAPTTPVQHSFWSWFGARPAADQTPAPEAVVTTSASPAGQVALPEQTPVSLESQQKQAQDIAALAEKSEQLYRQIADIANDQYTVQVKRKMAQVDDILNNLKENKNRLLRQIQEEQWKRQQEELKARQEERHAEIVKLYREGQEYVSSQEYAKAKIVFLELENMSPDYRATRRYLNRIEEYQRQAGIKAVTTQEQQEAERFKSLQEKETTESMRRIQQEQQEQNKIDQQQQSAIKELAQKASDINDELILLAHQQNYEGMKLKFAELENTVNALMTLKDEMTKQKDNLQRERRMARESIAHQNEITAGQQNGQMQMYLNQQAPVENRPVFQPSTADQYKRREIVQEQNMLYSEAVDRYEHKKYTQAKLLFGELADQHDRRAEVWLKKVDHAITQELLTSQVSEERERTAFIADQVKAQRELIVIQERERQRQKKLTEELERQKRLYEDDHLLQLRKEEAMKAQVLERERQEEKRKQLEKEKEKQQEMLRFHKIDIVVNPKPTTPPVPVAAPIVKPVPQPVVVVTPPAPKVIAPPAMTPQQLREQARQARLKAQAEARAKLEEARQAKRAAEVQAKFEKAKEQAARLAQEQKHREELLREQAQQREEKIKQEKIMREEAQRRQELELQEHQRQAQLEARREAVRKQLEDGVEAMYKEALDLYNQGNYTAAADKFKDVQDILPGYKRAGQYMDEARLKSLNEPTPSAPTPASPSVSRQDDVSKALDLFDPNAK